MKIIILSVCVITAALGGNAQITTPIVKANFGVEADLNANYFNNLNQPAGDDWFSAGNIGSGRGIIDTTGAAAIVAGYTSNPASRKNAFFKLMAYPAYTTLNNRLLLDAIYHRDYHGLDSTVFASGSNKNGHSPAIWTTPVAQSIPDKNDILEGMVHVRRAGPNATDSLWMFSGLSLENTTGNRFFDFELYQTDITYNKNTLSFSGYGPDAGHTSWILNASGFIQTPGDIIFTAEFSSSTLSLVEARIWVHRSMLSIVPVTFDWGGQFDGNGSSAQYGYANILPKKGGTFYTGLQSTVAATWAGPFKVVRDNDVVLNDYTPRQFMEFSVNLTKLGIEPASYGDNPCGSPFRRVLIKTRASTSFTAELKDFVAPFSVFNYPPVDAYTELLYYCGTMPEVQLDVLSPNPNSVYTWYTNNGNIVGSNIGPSIIVNAPGTYYVQQQLHAQCAYTSLDSLTIMFTPECLVLDVNINNLSAAKQGSFNALKWNISNNETVKEFYLETSTDNFHFKRLAIVPATNMKGDVSYTFKDASNGIDAPVVFYRIRVVGKSAATKLSNIVVLRSFNSGKKDAIIYPVPTHGALKLSCSSAISETATLNIINSYGKLVIVSKIDLIKGENIVNLPSLNGMAQGTYYARVKTSAGDIVQRIVLLNK